MINLASTGIMRSSKLDNKPKQNDVLFAKFSLAVIGACGVAKNPHIFLTITNHNIKEINRHFDGTLNHYFFMVFSENQEQNESYILKDML